MARVARRRLLVSVPREPLWRGLNVARGAYLRRTRQHAGSREPLVQALVRLAAARYGTVEQVRSPFPWTMLLVRVGLDDDRAHAAEPRASAKAASRGSRLRPGRGDPLGRDRRHRG